MNALNIVEQSELDAIFKALSHPIRRQILCWLKAPEQHFPEQHYSLEQGVCAGQLERCTGLSQSTTSVHLSVLQKAGLVTSHRVGQWVFFKRDEQTINRLIDFLGEF